MSLTLSPHVVLSRGVTTSPNPTWRQQQRQLSLSSSPSTMIMPMPMRVKSRSQIALMPAARVCMSPLAYLIPPPLPETEEEVDPRRSRTLRRTLTLDPAMKPDLRRISTPVPCPEPETSNDNNDDDGSGAGKIGDGGSGGGDDDTYHIWGDDNNFDPEGNKLKNIFKKRKTFPEIFDKDTIDAVLSEWMMTTKDLPFGVRLAYDLGLFSSIQFTRFFFFNSWRRSSAILRFFSRSQLPANVSAFFNGKLIADPSLPSKLVLEMVSSFTLSAWFDFESRGKDLGTFKKEWDRILLNAITASICNVFVSFWLAPCCLFSYGSKSHQWQKALGKLPQNVFERSYKFKKFDIQKRVLAFFSKGVSLFMVGFATKGAQTIIFLSTGHSMKKNKAAHAAAFDRGLFLALNSNLRHQIVWGLDRFLFEYFDVMGVALFFDFAARISNAWIGVKQENQSSNCSSHWPLNRSAANNRGGPRIFQLIDLSTNWPSVKRKRKKTAIVARST